jgi:hypothetical protein
MSNWTIVAGGSGEYDYIGMIGDFIEEKISSFGSPDPGKVDNCIRAAVAEVWRDYARYEQRAIPINMLIASRSDDHPTPRLTVVSGAAVRRGGDMEAIGKGDATFKALADRFIQHGQLTTVSADVKAAEIFMVYAMLQAKLSIPGIGGNTRVMTITDAGGIRYMKSWSVSAIQGFFNTFDSNIRVGVQSLAHHAPGDDPDAVEQLLMQLGQDVIQKYRELKAQLLRIENDPLLR